MNSSLSQADLDTLRQRLLDRRRELEEELKAQLHRSGLDRQGDASSASAYDEPHDRGDESVADEQTALAAAEAARDSRELEAIDAALARMASGSYGICIETGEEIERERLLANPSATRSLAGQTAWEKRTGQRPPSL